MTESAEIEAPNWLSELEKKREKRLKARLGHEAGAGAPCIKCNEKCPGLDLHFWRKICKNCKCSKEDHDVHDDDIYGWAQFQLLGSKPSKTRKKIVLPGKKDEVELEWAPKGNNETIDQYLKTLAPETLPVKGSQAAQDRKQLLQKQIPIHDIDPSLCHELTDSELAKFQDYIKHMKSSAGVGQIIQFNINYGSKHHISEANVKVVSDRYPKGVPSMETVQLLGERKTSTITKQFDKLALQDQRELDAFFDKIPKPVNMTAHTEKLGYIPGAPLESTRTLGNHPNSGRDDFTLPSNHPQNLEINQNKNLGYVNQPGAEPYPSFPPPPPLETHPQLTEINQNQNFGPPLLNHLMYNRPDDAALAAITQNVGYIPPPGFEHLPPPPPPPTEINNPNSATRFAREHLLNAQNPPGYASFGYEAEPTFTNEINRNTGTLPHYVPGSLNIHTEQQNPTTIGNVRDVILTHDLTNSNYKPSEIGSIGNVRETHDLTNSNYKPESLQQNPIPIGNVRGTHDLANSNYKHLQAFNPNQLSISENQLVPNPVNIGAIRDITYENPEIKAATHAENPMFEGLATGVQIPEDVDLQTKQCRKCSKFFDQGEFAIFVEKSNSLYHSECFKCAGCNQNLADLLYFYDKESNDVYCGRDFAKIRGIPRCRACDELIFVKEYCLAENSTYHLKHFCCFECDQALAGQNYVLEDSQTVCIPCFEKLKANKCISCERVIRPDEEGVALAEGIHFHVADECFCCSVCRKVLHGAKLLFRNNKLYCSHDCFRSDK